MWGPISVCLFFDCLILLSTSYHWRLNSIVVQPHFVERFIHQWSDGLGFCIYVLTIVSSTVKLSVCICTYPHVELLHHMVILWIILLGIRKLPVSPCLSNTFPPPPWSHCRPTVCEIFPCGWDLLSQWASVLSTFVFFVHLYTFGSWLFSFYNQGFGCYSRNALHI